MTVDDWCQDIHKAQAMSIDAFGLNIAFQDPNNEKNLKNVFQAAESLGSQFKLYLNFDYLAWGVWDIQSVVKRISQFKQSSAYFHYLGRPFVSTFEGTGNVQDWTAIKRATDCFFVPDWSSLGAVGASKHLGIADGLASWNAWPEGPQKLGTGDDELYISSLRGRPYMMPVSPWFFTNLPNYGKNWLWRSDGLWHYRWEQAVQLSRRVQFIQIITWNDYGESHYIGPLRPQGVPAGSGWYVADHDHAAWGILLPRYISAFKSGDVSILRKPPSRSDNFKEQLIYWYRTNPGESGSASGTTGNNQNYQKVYPPHTLAEDRIFITVLLEGPAEIVVRIGRGTEAKYRVKSAGVSHISTPFGGQVGAVQFAVRREGNAVLTTTGPAITTECCDGKVNWNPVVGHA